MNISFLTHSIFGTKHLIILAICIMYLICGGISGVISFVLNLVGGIV